MLLPGIEWNKAPHRHGEFFHADATIVQISTRRNSDIQEGAPRKRYLGSFVVDGVRAVHMSGWFDETFTRFRGYGREVLRTPGAGIGAGLRRQTSARSARARCHVPCENEGASADRRRRNCETAPSSVWPAPAPRVLPVGAPWASAPAGRRPGEASRPYAWDSARA